MGTFRSRPDSWRPRPLWLPVASLRLAAVLLLAVSLRASLVRAEAEEPPYGLVAAGAGDFSPFGDGNLVPRYFWDSMAPAIARRDDGTNCGSGLHSCLDINSTLCCANDRYCLIDPTTKKPACCAIGSTCGSPCNDTQYECTLTSTVTLPAATSKVGKRATSTASAAGTTASSLTETTTTPAATGVTTTHLDACCARHCPLTSMFQCAAAFGGGCCSFGQTCASEGQCIWTASATDSGGASSTVAAASGGCTTGQVSCASTMGGGCCDAGHSCVVLTNKAYCAVATPTGSGITVVSQDSGGGLSSGAKAGIGIGVAVGASAIIGGLTWFCLRQRSRARRMSMQQQGDMAGGPMEEYRQQQHGNGGWSPLANRGVFAHSGGGGGGSNSQISPVAQRWRNPLTGRRNTNESGPVGPGGAPGGPAESEAGGESGVGMGRLRGLTQDYYGPDAVPGPFTMHPTGNTAPLGGAIQNARGVPVAPHGPHDIVAPVEIDSTAKAEMDASSSSISPVGGGAGGGQPAVVNNGGGMVVAGAGQAGGQHGPMGTAAVVGAGVGGVGAIGATAAASMAQYGHLTQMSQMSPNGVGGGHMTLGQSRDVHNFDMGVDPGEMLDDPNEEKGERERRIYSPTHPGGAGAGVGGAGAGANGVDVDDSALEEQPPPPQYGPDPHSVVNGHYELYGSDVIPEKSAAAGAAGSVEGEDGQAQRQRPPGSSHARNSGIPESPIDPQPPSFAPALERFPPAPTEDEPEEEGRQEQTQQAPRPGDGDAGVGPVSPGSPTGSNEAVSPLESRSRAVSNVSNTASNPRQSPPPPLPDTLGREEGK